MLVIADLLVTLWIVAVGFLVWYLFKHLVDEHVDASVGFDELFELFENGLQVGRVVVDVFDDAFEPFFVNSVISGKPVAHSEQAFIS